MRHAGFVEVEAGQFRLPQNTWPQDKVEKTLGYLNSANLCAGIEGWSLRPFIKGLGYSREQLDILLAEVRRDIRNTQIHAYWPM